MIDKYSLSDLINCSNERVQVFARASLMVKLAVKYDVRSHKFFKLQAQILDLTASVKLGLGQLDNINIITHRFIYAAAKAHKSACSDDKYKFFGIRKNSYGSYKKSKFAVALQKFAESNAEAKRKSDLNHRISSECLFMSYQGWYPVFLTLTVSDLHYEAVFSNGSRAFSDYIFNLGRELNYWCNKSFFGSGRNISDNFRYVCVVESGTHGTKRMHLHVLAFLKQIPGYVLPPKQELHRCFASSFKTTWSYGFSTIIPVRISRSDVYARAGYTWPSELKNDTITPLRESSIKAISGYMSKYITKQLEKDKDTYTWRTRMTRGYGLQFLHSIYKAHKNILTTISPLLIIRQMNYPVKLPSLSLMLRVWKSASIKSMSSPNLTQILRKILTAGRLNIYAQLLYPQLLVRRRKMKITTGLQRSTMMNLAISEASLLQLQSKLLLLLQPIIMKLYEENECLRYMK